MNLPLIRSILPIAFLLLAQTSTASGPTAQLTGTVTDDSGYPLIGATVQVIDTPWGTVTDDDGRYRLRHLSPGLYTVQTSHIGYQPSRRQVEIGAGRTDSLDFTLASAVHLLDEVLVVGAITSAQARALNAQNAAPNIRSITSHELFTRFPDRNAAETLQRLPGVALDRDQGEGEYVQIRGLNAQFNSVTVNGQRIPSPTANLNEGRAVGLDLLQLHNVGTVEITKALTPDMDADALGGAVNLVLKRAPKEPELSLNLATGYGDRAARFSEWSGEQLDLAATAGRRLLDNRLGLIFGTGLQRTGRGPLLHQVAYASPDSNGVDYSRWDNYDVRRHRSGLLVGADCRVTANHDLRLNLTYNRFLDDEIRRRRQFNPGSFTENMEIRNRREDQQYGLLELAGQQRISRLTVAYALSLARASEELPDRTYFLFIRANPYLDAQGNPLSPSAILDLDLETSFSTLDPFALYRNRYDNKKFTERDRTGQLDAEYTFDFRGRQSSAKTGFKVLQKKKEASERRWEYRQTALGLTTDENDYPFVDVKYDDPEALDLFPLNRYKEQQQFLNYDAEETVYAAYAMATLHWTPRLTSLFGIRTETTQHAFSHLTQFKKSDEAYHNLLPSLHLTYRFAHRTNLRLALTSGLARPEYTRLLPLTALLDDEIYQGNPDLLPARSFGVDLMLESFSGPLGLLSAGLFAKRILDPVVARSYRQESLGQIFRVTEPINGQVGHIWGIELSLVQQLATLDLPLLRHVSLYANYTYSAAEMDYGTERTDDGPLPGSARHVANGGFFFDDHLAGRSFTLSCNYRSPMLKQIERDPRDDIWFDRQIHLDLSGRQRLTSRLDLFLKLNNLTDQGEREILGDPYDASIGTRWRERESYGPTGLLGLRYTL